MKKLFRNMWAELRECNTGLQWGWGEDCYYIHASRGKGKEQSQKHEKALQEGAQPMQPMSVRECQTSKHWLLLLQISGGCLDYRDPVEAMQSTEGHRTAWKGEE